MAALIISVASVQAQKSQVIAHRGYWKTAGSAQKQHHIFAKGGFYTLLWFRI